ncbi:efflux RND transporter periplasmic adaptor subunit [Novispirillum itersonii]|uniref:efflux RND transporter periplasmic adaptor subunit n=1 Tax=Novispirillum itersonii TaxID=189 RepID=UPI0003695E77|nr:HlyD family efflux transporter periplasmic adaptor subunit [Novispirillum itersonii]
MPRTLPVLALLALLTATPAAAETLTVRTQSLPDEKAVYATVVSADTQVARARISGTVAAVHADEGDSVQARQVLAVVGDAKLLLKRTAAEAQVASLRAERAQAATELARAQELYAQGATPKARLDQARTALEVLDRTIAGQLAERQVVDATTAEGEVLSPGAGRVLEVKVIPGSVVMPGEAIATVATGRYLLRLEVPERHARFLTAGTTVRVGDRGLDPAASPPALGTVSKVYPRLTEGRVKADVQVDGLGTYFVGERAMVWLPTGERDTLRVPVRFLTVRFGVTFATLSDPAHPAGREVPVQTGNRSNDPQQGEMVEILSGLRDGDTLQTP